jgi:high-affinity iron transporter
MIATSIIVFREIFEISIILSIISAATSRIDKRGFFVFIGIVLGIIGSFILAIFVNKFSSLFNGFGQEVINSVILAIAIFLICWTIIWVNMNARLFGSKLEKASQNIILGAEPLYVISIIIATTIFREGFEIILFLNGVYAAGSDFKEMIKGIFLGLSFGIVVSFFVYKGLLRLHFKNIFKITTLLLVFFAAKMASEIANLLSAANYLSFGHEVLWDSSWIISQDSLLGKVMNVVFGYEAKPSLMQFIFYVSVIIFIFVSLRIIKNNKKPILKSN